MSEYFEYNIVWWNILQLYASKTNVYVYMCVCVCAFISWVLLYVVELGVKNLSANAEDVKDTGLIPGSEDLLEEDSPFQCSCLENPTDRGAWWAAVHRVTKSQTQL